MARYKLKRNKFYTNRHDIVIENKNIPGIDFPYYIVAFCNSEEIEKAIEKTNRKHGR